MKTNIYKRISTLALGAGLIMGASMSSCTSGFEDYNTDPFAPTPEQMNGDFAKTAALIGTMQTVALMTQENDYQMYNQMIGNEYGRMCSAGNKWGTNQYYATYNPPVGWSGGVFDTYMPRIYTSYFQIRKDAGEGSLPMHWANLIRIIGTLTVSDTYGPTPYSLIGGSDSFQVAYDDMETLYNAMFKDIDEAIDGLKASAGSSAAAANFGSFDNIYNGNLTKWIKLGNTYKLRMALRLVNVNPSLAQQKAEEAVSDPYGVLETVDDSAWTTFLPGGNSIWKVYNSWDEGRVSADITSYMSGYNDPRLAHYCTALADGTYAGARSGVYHYQTDYSSAWGNLSKVSVPASQKPSATDTDAANKTAIMIIPASEAWFARAEGALRGWAMGGSAKSLYEQGVTVNMTERGETVGNYLSSTATPADYVDPNGGRFSIAAVSTVCPAFDESADFETNLERIIVQKWIGNYPNGWESWADFRRTGYPKWFPIVDNLSTSGVTTARGMRRLPFPQSEFNTNETNVKAAQAMLGGPDTGATDLWWAKKN